MKKNVGIGGCYWASILWVKSSKKQHVYILTVNSTACKRCPVVQYMTYTLWLCGNYSKSAAKESLWHCVPPAPYTGLYFFRLVGRLPLRMISSKYHRIFSIITVVIADFIYFYKICNTVLLYDNVFHMCIVSFSFTEWSLTWGFNTYDVSIRCLFQLNFISCCL